MKLYLLRHGIAEPHGSGLDAERRLTAEGETKLEKVAYGLKKLETDFNVILSSPFARAKQTAQIIKRIFNFDLPIEYSNRLIPEANPRQIIKELMQTYPKVNSILLTGHEPHLSTLISFLISGAPNLDITLKKGGACKLLIDDLREEQCATLKWLLTPRQLALLST